MLTFSNDLTSFRDFVDNEVNSPGKKMFPYKPQLAPSTFCNHWYLMKITRLETILKIDGILLNICNFRQEYVILCVIR